jgi:hypothetical protein
MGWGLNACAGGVDPEALLKDAKMAAEPRMLLGR